MTSQRLGRWMTVGALLALPVMADAQEATLRGTVSDTTGGALPGVTVRAVHEASGNSFETVTDARGDYRIPARVGAYRVTADLAGFAPVTRPATLLVGQEAAVDLQMAVSGVQESVTVTGEAPLLDVTRSSLGGNIDSRQLETLPIQGRNWIDLIMLAPGARPNAVTDTPSDYGGAGRSRVGGDFGLNVDGQQVTMLMGSCSCQARFSRDAIAEFEFVSSRFDATQGRSRGLQVNAVTKSGTNALAGSFAGYYRHDRFNAADFVAKRVIPYQDRQLSGTVGGPLRKDKVHFFANYEFESEPVTAVFSTPYPHFNVDLSEDHTEKKAGARLDAQFSSRTRLAARFSRWDQVLPGAGSASATPSGAPAEQGSRQFLVPLTQVLSNQVVNEVKVGYASIYTILHSRLKNPNGMFDKANAPAILLQGFVAGGSRTYPNNQWQDVYSVRDDFTYSYSKGGRHTMKMGAEYLDQAVEDLTAAVFDGQLDATGGPVPRNIESVFPDLFDVSTWNLAPLSPVSVRWTQTFGRAGSTIKRKSTAVWLQDDWTVTPRLTLNLGVRYDLELNAFANDVKMLPFLTGNQPQDKNNVGPRLGFGFSANDRTVVRGGGGLYFGTVMNGHLAKLYEQTIQTTVAYDGRLDFASNPWNGPTPTYESLLARLCTPALLSGCIRREAITQGAVYGPQMVMPYAWQGSIGLQRQMGTTLGIEADYVYVGDRGQQDDLPVNISYNPATGANYPFSDISKRPFPEWGFVSLTVPGARANRHALQTAFTKRFSHGWQASGTYSLSALRDARPAPIQWNGSRFEPVPFPTARDLGGEYTLAVGDQRHRATVNGLWELRYGFQISGLYFFGSGDRYDSRYGRDVREIGSIRPNEHRLRPDGSIVPRNDFVGKPLHRVDLRVQRRFPLRGRAGIDGLLEVFNAFNHTNFGSYAGHVGTTVGGEVTRNYGAPQQSSNVAYLPRTLQLGFRFAF